VDEACQSIAGREDRMMNFLCEVVGVVWWEHGGGAVLTIVQPPHHVIPSIRPVTLTSSVNTGVWLMDPVKSISVNRVKGHVTIGVYYLVKSLLTSIDIIELRKKCAINFLLLL